jgi:hypothetical protein
MRLVSLLALLAGCAIAPLRPTSEARESVVRAARAQIGERALPWHHAGCLALPRLAFGASGVELAADSPEALYRKLAREGHVFQSGSPRGGDLVFMRDLHGPAGDLHVGVVGRVEADGTVLVYQRMARGVEAYRMNLAHPHDEHAPLDHHSWNDSITAGNGDTAPAGALFSAYASILP